jgi:tRNA A37 threonylcarbamoyladenosine dehydratase
MMEDTVLWNAILTGGVGVIAWVIRSCMVELNRLNILINRTREEIAKEYVTKLEQKDQMTYVIDKIEALDAKLDRLLERSNGQ